VSALGIAIIAGVLALLAIVAWAAAWQTMHWLGDAEDLIEDLVTWGAFRYTDADGTERVRAVNYKRRTPRRG
jgi:hypothetical protein